MCFIQINGKKERVLSLQTGQIFSLASEIDQTFFNKGINKENKNTHILIITVKVAPSVMMGWDEIQTDCTKNTRVNYVSPEGRR